MGAVSRGLLDTSVVIARAEEDLEAALPEEASISVATLAELHFGVLVAREGEIRRERLRRLGQVEALFDPLPLSAEVGRAFATVAFAVKAAGGQPRARVMDLWIAATALAYNLPLYTRNLEDFKLLEQLIEVRPL
jgi:predicted nucleic acid-binding protein